jgi:hypothetical protein
MSDYGSWDDGETIEAKSARGIGSVVSHDVMVRERERAGGVEVGPFGGGKVSGGLNGVSAIGLRVEMNSDVLSGNFDAIDADSGFSGRDWAGN